MAERLRSEIARIECAARNERDADAQIANLDAQYLLTCALLPLNSVARRRVTDAIQRQERRDHEAREQRREMRERTMHPVHVPIGKGATMVLWTEK